MKLAGKIYKGIHYVELKDLPEDHQRRITESYGNQCLIKILIDNTIVKNCIQYKDYESWYETAFKAAQETTSVITVKGSLILNTGS